MSKIYGSASKIVFISLALTACIAFIMKVLPVDQFMILCMAAFSFYFAKPTSSNVDIGSGVEK